VLLHRSARGANWQTTCLAPRPIRRLQHCGPLGPGISRRKLDRRRKLPIRGPSLLPLPARALPRTRASVVWPVRRARVPTYPSPPPPPPPPGHHPPPPPPHAAARTRPRRVHYGARGGLRSRYERSRYRGTAGRRLGARNREPSKSQEPTGHLPISNRPAPQVTSPRTVCHFPSQASPCTGPTHRRDRCKRAPTNDSADGPDRHQTRASITTAVGTGPRPEDAPPRCLCLEGLPRHYTAGGCSCYQAPSKSHRRSLPLRLTLRYTGRQPLTGAHNGSELCPPSTTRGRPNEISCTLGRPPRPRCQLDTPTRQPTPVLGSAAVFQFGIVACAVVLRLAGG